MSVISNSVYPSDVINIGGEYMAIFLIILLSVSLLVSDTKYWNEYISNILKICSNPLLLVFVTIVIFKIILVI